MHGDLGDYGGEGGDGIFLGLVGAKISIKLGNLRDPATKFLRGKSLAKRESAAKK